jgi:hypothetical protein
MKKIFLLMLFILTIKGFGQTYTISVSVNHPLCEYNTVYYTLKGGANIITNYSNVQLYNTFTLDASISCSGDGPPPMIDADGNPVPYTCSNSFSRTESAINLIKLGTWGIGGCNGSVMINEFKPNVTITNNTGPSICSGQLLDLVASAGFPNEAYHWQFSKDNKATWIDVPSSIGSNPKTNDTPQTAFSINQLLGVNSEQYFNEKIYFRLGYGQSRPFSNVITLIYSPCGPTISNIAFVGPECNGDIVKSLAITFGQKLNSTLGEKLASISVCDINSSKIFMQINGPVSYPDNTKTYTYTTFQNLETGHYYKIRYQAQITDPDDPSKTIMKGVLDSPTALNFLYIDPVKMEFKITNFTQPSCFGGNNGTAEIQILSGQSPYHFYKDGVELTGASQPTFSTGKYYITGLGEKTYDIMVTDSKKCIDKTAND